MKNIEKRRRIMNRSIRLGHCVCDPRKGCPCDIFRQQDICLCTGERPQTPLSSVKLTKLVSRPGCASKIDQAFLKRILKNLPSIDDPRVIIGIPAGDDAGIYDIGGGKALVQTVDVFTPSVDDPYIFGQIAAANSVSDIYAMGAVPLTALSIIGFPAGKITDNVMVDILRGGIDKMNQAGVAIIGGHSINDEEIKAGFAVTGIIDSDKIVTNAAAQPGDVLILTKPLGTGIIAFASQIDRAQPESLKEAADSMAALNKTASQLMVEHGAHTCTDITGFGLMGHLSEMASSSKVDVEIVWDNLPLFTGILNYAAAGVIPGAVERNRESSSHAVIADESLTDEMLDICFDAQTSGGLLISIAENKADRLLVSLHQQGVSKAAIIGKILNKGPGRVYVRTDRSRKIPMND